MDISTEILNFMPESPFDSKASRAQQIIKRLGIELTVENYKIVLDAILSKAARDALVAEARAVGLSNIAVSDPPTSRQLFLMYLSRCVASARAAEAAAAAPAPVAAAAPEAPQAPEMVSGGAKKRGAAAKKAPKAAPKAAPKTKPKPKPKPKRK